MESLGDIKWIFAAAGALLVFSAILGGGFQIKEITIPRLRKGTRFLAGVAGIGFIVLSVLSMPSVTGVPKIEFFQGNPLNIDVGDTSTLSWSVSDATRVTIEPLIGSVALTTGQRPVLPDVTTHYVLTATNDAGSAIATILVQVGSSPAVERRAPIVNSFQLNPDFIKPGDSTILSWSVSGATIVIISPGIGSVALAGERKVFPVETITYSLTAANDAGNSYALALIDVRTPSQAKGTVPVVSFFQVSQNLIDFGKSSTLSWSVSDATNITINPEVGNVALSGQEVVSPSKTTAYTLIAKNSAGETTANAIIQVKEQIIGTPDLALKGTELYEVRENQFVRYDLTVKNWASFPAELFEPAPDLPPCGLNTNSSRTWVTIHNATNDKHIYGFCTLSSTEQLNSIWFAVERDTSPPEAVYVLLRDRREDVTYRSNDLQLID